MTWDETGERHQITQGLGYLRLGGTDGLEQGVLVEMEDNRVRYLLLLELTGLADGLDDKIQKKVGLDATS